VYYTCLLPHYPWEPTPDSGVPLKPAADGVGDRQRYMGDMVAYLDKQVGQLVATLESLGLRQNTVVIFVSDNGTDQRVISDWSDGSVQRKVRGGKGTMTDAGTRVPLIVNWPGRIKPGQVVDDLIDLSDLMPTLLDLAGVTDKPALDGRSFAPQLRGEPGTPRRWIHVQDQQQRHVRDLQFILTHQGELRPVVGIGEKRADPIRGELTPEQAAAREALQAAFKSISAP
jgi:arylsulfatase A